MTLEEGFIGWEKRKHRVFGRDCNLVSMSVAECDDKVGSSGGHERVNEASSW